LFAVRQYAKVGGSRRSRFQNPAAGRCARSGVIQSSPGKDWRISRISFHRRSTTCRWCFDQARFSLRLLVERVERQLIPSRKNKCLLVPKSFIFPVPRSQLTPASKGNVLKKSTLIVSLSAIACSAQFVSAENKTAIRFGHFPNITHAQGVIAHALTRQHKGWFEERLGPGFEVQWFTYNAGPSAMEAIFAGS